ncbi:hypothetical protein FOZ63_016571 [Perkinsus olseni]|uniref:Uncharacterized protein n=1 Tax=Perkinsus olseni TaxID=32597 RepID=A0A7J6TRP7_PEROL|nr:hypothetical protein FOZ62_019194 [Perkinsus olseni]KAF4748029.1 hypothetical protein FOZ63_016571 [Perkinsus olseni]
MATRLIASLSSAAVVLVNAVIPTDYGNFIYQSNGSYPVKMTFNTTKEGHARFSIECERRYEDSFRLHPNPLDVEYGSIHEFAKTGSGAADHQLLLDKVRDACPQLSIEPEDFQWFYVGDMGNLHTELEGDIASLERQWLSLRPGRYIFVDAPITQKYDIFPNGYVYVKLGCEVDGTRGPSDTGYKPFRLVAKDNGQRYELTAIRGHGTVEDLKESLMRICHIYDGAAIYAHFEEEVKRFRFAEGYYLFALGEYTLDRIHGEPLRR